nr:MAG TPA: hypothetical protein [Caudoviricetes sp.]
MGGVFFMGKYSSLQFVCLKTAYNKSFNWGNAATN